MDQNIEEICAYMDAHHLLRLAYDDRVTGMLTKEELTGLLEKLLEATSDKADHDKLRYFLSTDSLKEELMSREADITGMLAYEDVCEAIDFDDLRNIAHYLTFYMPAELEELEHWLEFYRTKQLAITNEGDSPRRTDWVQPPTEQAKAADITSEVPQSPNVLKQVGSFPAQHTKTYTEPKSYYRWSEEDEQVLKECVNLTVKTARECLNNEPTEAAIITRAYALGLKVKKGIIRAN